MEILHQTDVTYWLMLYGGGEERSGMQVLTINISFEICALFNNESVVIFIMSIMFCSALSVNDCEHVCRLECKQGKSCYCSTKNITYQD